MTKTKKKVNRLKKLEAIQYTKKLVTLIMVASFGLSCFGTYINYKNGYSLDAIVLKWVDFSIWIGGIYLTKSFAETFAKENNDIKKELIGMQNKVTSDINSDINNSEVQNDTVEYEEVDI